MGVHNGERWLKEAIDSLLKQTLRDFELIAVDDGSTDSTQQILSTYGDERIVVVRNAEKLGLTRSLNRGLALARGKYVARLDADDVAEPDRLERQVAFFDNHASCDILGTEGHVINDRGAVVRRFRASFNGLSEYTYLMYYGTPVIHSSLMARRDVFESLSGYDERFPIRQDLVLYLKHASRGGRIHLLHEPLIRLRQHGASVSATDAEARQMNVFARAVCHLEASGAGYDWDALWAKVATSPVVQRYAKSVALRKRARNSLVLWRQGACVAALKEMAGIVPLAPYVRRVWPGEAVNEVLGIDLLESLMAGQKGRA